MTLPVGKKAEKINCTRRLTFISVLSQSCMIRVGGAGHRVPQSFQDLHVPTQTNVSVESERRAGLAGAHRMARINPDSVACLPTTVRGDEGGVLSSSGHHRTATAHQPNPRNNHLGSTALHQVDAQAIHKFLFRAKSHAKTCS